MSNYDKTFDENIVLALKRLPMPLKTAKGNYVYFVENKRMETIFEHIANKKHRLTVKDINIVPIILKDKSSLKPDRSGHKFHTYIGKRAKKKEKMKYLKIVTKVNSNMTESIITIYLIKKVE